MNVGFGSARVRFGSWYERRPRRLVSLATTPLARYSIEVKAVHAQAGVMDDMNAAKGVLVTTSGVGKASRDFAARNGNRIQIIEGCELKHLLREHLSIDALISLPRLQPGWEQDDIT